MSEQQPRRTFHPAAARWSWVFLILALVLVPPAMGGLVEGLTTIARVGFGVFFVLFLLARFLCYTPNVSAPQAKESGTGRRQLDPVDTKTEPPQDVYTHTGKEEADAADTESEPNAGNA